MSIRDWSSDVCSSDLVEAEFAKTYDMVDISNSEPTDVAQWRFVPDREKAALSGVSAADIANVLGLVYDGQVVGRAHIDPERNPVSSAEGRVGKEWVRRGRSRWSTYHKKKKNVKK